MEGTRKEIAGGVYLTYLPAQKFKTSLLSAQFVTPLTETGTAPLALLPAVLRRGTVRFPDMGRLSAELDRLYGAHLNFSVRKKAENQCVGFVASFIDDAFVPGGEGLLEPVAALMGEVFLSPVMSEGQFIADYVDSERTNLIDAIRSIINDKREYADLRLLQTMCAGEPYGISRFGSEDNVRAIDMRTLLEAYRQLLSSARLELFYSGSAPRQHVGDALLNAFSALPRQQVRPLEYARPHPARSVCQTVMERLDVTQGKLGMGFACGSEDETALLVGNTLFGGSSNSKLFLNVREKLSLCYFASSVYHRSKSMITVSSGIEFENYQRAYDEIMAQLQSVQQGELEDWELDGARSTLLNSYATIGDSQAKLENFYLGQAATGRSESPAELARAVQEITPQRIFDAMKTVTLDTVYFLKGLDS